MSSSVFGGKKLPTDIGKLQELLKCVVDQEKLNEGDRSVALARIKKYQSSDLPDKLEKWQNFLQDIDERSEKISKMKKEILDKQSEVVDDPPVSKKSSSGKRSLYTYDNPEMVSSFEDVTTLLNMPPGKLAKRANVK